ncbi:hypothetical protein AVEN_148194-1 [Araneus ventricosus]|uniref:Uncharacterized protein n=1 Tax=Araneus ventricosus TaxID=182803 RepID=A0A4Y2DA44_ARAVE|nr:hypothetical protein AVEN_148194-1 [Araneus ventricosus]
MSYELSGNGKESRIVPFCSPKVQRHKLISLILTLLFLFRMTNSHHFAGLGHIALVMCVKTPEHLEQDEGCRSSAGRHQTEEKFAFRDANE